MKVGRVIGSVVLCESLAELRGARWLIVCPLGAKELATPDTLLLNRDAGVVVYDQLGAHTGDLIGYTEGGEAARPFNEPTPVDAYCAAILDRIHFSPAE